MKDRLVLRPFVPWVLAGTFFPFLLFYKRFGPLDFWWAMAITVAALVVSALYSDETYAPSIREDARSGLLRKIALGILSAAILYGVFALGDELSRKILPFARQGIEAVYGLKAGVSPLRAGLLLFFWIGPGEEFFWRGYIQRSWQRRMGPAALPLTVAFYAAVHIASGNTMLVLAAAVGGLYWGILYQRSRSIILVAVSHALWDLAVFVLFPFA